MFSLNEIIAALGGPVRSGRSLLFSEAVIDSRQLINGTLFVALTGEKTDGHSSTQIGRASCRERV